ncbi:MAG: nucleotidyl transferase AbiEii/AbiGii toxin family protein [Burkholderiales bacterium]|nr:nucleotidyl transferase AbiEii/AbiGii toxin family protein [Burkholderiales bacterium]
MTTVVEQMLSRYPRETDEQTSHALREVMQELGRIESWWVLLSSFSGPRWALGRAKTAVTDIASAFLKKSSSLYDINVQGQRALKIKFEVDTDPPQLFLSEQKLLLQPYSFYVNCFALPDLYAGKMHALLFRKWKNRVKGRDWFDFEWYVRRSVTLNLSHFAERARQSGHWQGEALGQEEFLAMLQDRIASLDIASARSDVLPFVREPAGLEIWSKDYFAQLAQRILFA